METIQQNFLYFSKSAYSTYFLFNLFEKGIFIKKTDCPQNWFLEACPERYGGTKASGYLTK